MAIDTSKAFEKRLELPHLPYLHLRRALRKPIAKYREGKRGDILSKSEIRTLEAPCGISDAFERQSNHFKEHGWAFIDPIFTTEFHSELVKNWPSRVFFDPPRTVKKGYDYGFRWQKGDAPEYQFASISPEIQSFRDLMTAPEMAQRVGTFTGWDHSLKCESVLATYSYPGTCVIPHRDTVAGQNTLPTANLIFFVNGSGGDRSGGLALSHDNELKNVIFEPQKLTNTCLIYDTSAPFYHGFEPIKWGKFRWMMSAHFTNS